MPTPIAICIENCYPPHESLRYLRCCAITGVEPGLIVSTDGEILWKSEAARYCELWVSSDEKLICFRPPGAAEGARIQRAGREVALEENKPVVVIDGDYLLLPSLCYRLHVHGQAPTVTPPGYLDFEEPASSTRTRLAAAGVMVLGTLSAAGCGTPPAEEKPQAPPVEVRDRPPANPLAKPMQPPTDMPPKATAPSSDATPINPSPPIEVRVEPPQVPRPTPPPTPPPTTMTENATGDPMSTDPMKPPTGEMKPPPIEVRVHPPKPIAPLRDPLD